MTRIIVNAGSADFDLNAPPPIAFPERIDVARQTVTIQKDEGGTPPADLDARLQERLRTDFELTCHIPEGSMAAS